jgi:hypothetical protein
MLGSYLVPPGRPPVDPGIAGEMPRSFLGQLGVPFRNCVRGTEPAAAA